MVDVLENGKCLSITKRDVGGGTWRNIHNKGIRRVTRKRSTKIEKNSIYFGLLIHFQEYKLHI
jgi:hypothetical protein